MQQQLTRAEWGGQLVAVSRHVAKRAGVQGDREVRGVQEEAVPYLIEA